MRPASLLDSTLTIPVHQDRLFKKGGAHIKLGEPSEPRSNAITGGIYDNAGRKAALNGIGSQNQPILSLCFLVSSGLAYQPDELVVGDSQMIGAAMRPSATSSDLANDSTAHHFTFPAVPVLAETSRRVAACFWWVVAQLSEPTRLRSLARECTAPTGSRLINGTLAAAGYFLPVSILQPQAHDPRVASP